MAQWAQNNSAKLKAVVARHFSDRFKFYRNLVREMIEDFDDAGDTLGHHIAVAQPDSRIGKESAAIAEVLEGLRPRLAAIEKEMTRMVRQKRDAKVVSSPKVNTSARPLLKAVA